MVAMLVGLHLSGKRHNFAKRADNEQMGLLPQGMIIGKIRVAKQFLDPSQFLEQQKQVRFQHVHNQGMCQLLLTVSWDLRA